MFKHGTGFPRLIFSIFTPAHSSKSPVHGIAKRDPAFCNRFFIKDLLKTKTETHGALLFLFLYFPFFLYMLMSQDPFTMLRDSRPNDAHTSTSRKVGRCK